MWTHRHRHECIQYIKTVYMRVGSRPLMILQGYGGSFYYLFIFNYLFNWFIYRYWKITQSNAEKKKLVEWKSFSGGPQWRGHERLLWSVCAANANICASRFCHFFWALCRPPLMWNAFEIIKYWYRLFDFWTGNGDGICYDYKTKKQRKTYLKTRLSKENRKIRLISSKWKKL